MASGHPLPRFMIHSSAVNMSKFRMLTRWYRIDSSSCSMDNIPLVPKVHLAFVAASLCGFPRGLFAMLSQLSMVSQVRHDSLLFFPPTCKTFVIITSCISEVMLCGLIIFLFLRCFVRPLVLLCHCKLLEGIITCAVVPFRPFFVFSANNSCRITPHVQQDFSFACVLYTFRTASSRR